MANFIDYILKTKKLRQKDIAQKLGVSTAQISKWKAGDRIPSSRERELIELAGLFGDDPEWAILAQTENNAAAWVKYIVAMNDYAKESYTTSAETDEDPELATRLILSTLEQAGITIPATAPRIEDYDDETSATEEFDELISEFLSHYGPLIEWASRNIISDNDELFDDENNIKYASYDLALYHIDDSLLAKNGLSQKQAEEFKRKTRNQILTDISYLCKRMSELNIPLKLDYFKFFENHPAELDDEIMFDQHLIKGIENYLSYGEQLILMETRRLKKQLENMEKQIAAIPQDPQKT